MQEQHWGWNDGRLRYKFKIKFLCFQKLKMQRKFSV